MLNEKRNKPYAIDIFDAEYATPDIKILMRFQELVNEHFLKQRSAIFYCGQLQVSPARLNHLCKEYLGKTVCQVIQHKLFMEAVRLLCKTDLSVKQITFKLAFVNQAYFGRFIKKMSRFSPAELRAEWLKEGRVLV